MCIERVLSDSAWDLRPHGQPYTEATAWRATSRKGAMRAQLDEVYLQAHHDGLVPVVLARAADFYGPRVLNSSLGGTTFPAALTGGTVLALGDIDLPHSFSYTGDVARGLARLGETPDAYGRVWHLPTAPAQTVRQVLDLIRHRTGVPFETEVLDTPRPWGPLDETFMAEYVELFYQYTEPQMMDSSAFQERFGQTPTPLAEGLATTIAWYRDWLRAQTANPTGD